MHVQPRQPVHLDKMMDDQNHVHNSLRIEFYSKSQGVTQQRYDEGTKLFEIGSLYYQNHIKIKK